MVNLKSNHFWTLAALWCVVHVVLLVTLGIRDRLSDSILYLDSAHYLLTNAEIEEGWRTFYAVPIALLAGAEFFFPGQSACCYVAIQLLLSGIATYALYKATSILFGDSRAGLLSSILFLLWWEVIHWNAALMTESLQCSLICFTIYWLTRFKNTTKDYLILAVLLLANIFTRPTGVIVVGGVGIFLFQFHWNGVLQRWKTRAGVIIVVGVVTYFAALAMFSEWDFTEQYVSGNIVTYMNTTEGTTSYHESLRMNTENLWIPPDHGHPLQRMLSFAYHNPVHFFKAGMLKVFYLVVGVRPYYSWSHNVYSVVWLGAMYLLFVVGIKSGDWNLMKTFSVTVIVLNCLLISVSTVDWDNRFYVPMQPGIALIAGGGALALMLRVFPGFR